MTTATPLVSKATDRLRQLPRGLAEHEGFADAIRALKSRKPATFDGVWGSGCALLAAELGRHCPGPLVVVCPQASEVDEFSQDLALFADCRIDRLPAWETEPGERIIHDEIYGDRLRTLKRLAGTANAGLGGTADPTAKEPVDSSSRVFVASIHSLLQPTPRRETLANNTRMLRVGERVAVDDLLRWLTSHGYHATSAVELPGEFSSRGGIVDIFAADWYQPVRIELFDDEVESIRRFDVSSQRSIESLDALEVTILQPSDSDVGHFADYLPPNAWVLLIEPEKATQEGAAYLKRLDRAADFHSVPETMRRLGEFSFATAGALTAGTLGVTCRLQIESVERFSGDIGRVREELDRVGQGHDVMVVAPTEAEVERLTELLGTSGLAAAGRLSFPIGTLKTGFRMAAERTIVVTAHELFHRGELRRMPRRRLGKAIDSFLDLREGDLVVHLAHGIGRYRGLRLLEKAGHVEEHLEIEFHGGTKIYVPAAKIDLVQKYVGGTKGRPTLAKIGGQLWLRQKKAAEAAVMDMAADLLDVQAARVSRPGIAFAGDSEWQHEFDASFPYQPTPDQALAIEAVKHDMTSPRPMDRLLCGDVGFGKTEVAMRAAFKAVDSGYQVAVLVPTTILAEQHYQTFRERMAEFPFDIARLSRFCTPQEEREALERLAFGQIDIVIGTHRLASKDVDFYNLGLVVIDEEQRFGVEVKERLKTLRSTVDILTMTATPIPRTLHMSLVGVRDISNLETPPEDRIAVETRVTRWKDELIHHAIMRELNRGGQIYFVHNRVNDIEVVAKKLQRIVPDVTIGIGHGQMPEGQLEKVMVDFVNHRFDLLLATTIVESGLDIPNANTIFVDEADRYGLADLHQLRGRVGRYKHRAYCYLLIDQGKSLTPNAAKRLRAIEEFSDMGAGFAIAMRDLEIRGAGNILGTQQSGHIQAVGYELYCQLLETAVRKLKHMPPKLSLDVDVDLPGEAFLPDEYVPDMRLKIDIYRRLTRISNVNEIRDLETELNDRFGEPPATVRRMLEIAELRIDAAIWQIAAVTTEDNYLVFNYTDRGRIGQLAKRNKRPVRVVDHKSAYVPLDKPDLEPNRLLQIARQILRAG